VQREKWGGLVQGGKKKKNKAEREKSHPEKDLPILGVLHAGRTKKDNLQPCKKWWVEKGLVRGFLREVHWGGWPRAPCRWGKKVAFETGNMEFAHGGFDGFSGWNERWVLVLKRTVSVGRFSRLGGGRRSRGDKTSPFREEKGAALLNVGGGPWVTVEPAFGHPGGTGFFSVVAILARPVLGVPYPKGEKEPREKGENGPPIRKTMSVAVPAAGEPSKDIQAELGGPSPLAGGGKGGARGRGNPPETKQREKSRSREIEKKSRLARRGDDGKHRHIEFRAQHGPGNLFPRGG